jgi:hypothetical protein
MAESVKDLVIRLSLENSQLKGELAKTGKGMDNLGKKQKGLGASLGRLKAGYIALAGVLTGVVAVGIKSALKLASDFEEANNKFGVTFRGVSKEANAMRKELVDTYGLSTKAATELLGNTGDIISGFGIVGKEAVDLSGNVNKLAADLSSFANIPITEASEKLTKALVGEREGLKSLGIAILETDVKQKLAEKGQEKLTGTALKAARAQATYELAVEASQNALGDAVRTQDSYANQLRRMEAQFDDILLIVSQELFNAIGPLVTEFGKFLKTEKGLKIIDHTIRGITATVLVLGNTIRVVFNGIQIAIKTLVGSFQTVAEAFKALKNFNFSDFKKNVTKIWSETTESIKGDIVDIKDSYNNAYDAIADATKENTKLQIQGTNDIVEANEQAQTEITKLTQAEIRKRLKEEEDAAKKKKALQNQAVNGALDVARQNTNLITGITEEYNKRQLKAIKKANAEELEAFDRLGEEKEILQEEYDGLEVARKQALTEEDRNLLDEQLRNKENQLNGLETAEKKLQKQKEQREEELARKVAAAKLKAWKKQQKARILEIYANMFVAEISAYANLGPIAGTVAAAVIIANANIAAGAVAGQSPPEFAQGGVISGLSGRYPGNEDGIIAAQNGESVLNKGATAMLGADAIDMINKGLPIQPNVNIVVNGGNTGEAVETLNEYFKGFGGGRTLQNG